MALELKGGSEVDEVDELVGAVFAEDGEVVAEVELVGPGGHGVTLPSTRSSVIHLPSSFARRRESIQHRGRPRHRPRPSLTSSDIVAWGRKQGELEHGRTHQLAWYNRRLTRPD